MKNAKDWPNLAKYWDDYGHDVKFADVIEMKTSRHGFVALLFPADEEGMHDYATLASLGPDTGWEVQSDGHEPVTKAQWRKAKIPPGCDWLVFPGEDTYQ